jgi:CheY-like chemotaxis protein
MVNKPVVLYVEDDPQSRKMMKLLLKGRMELTGVTILEDSENFEAVVNGLEPKPTLVFLDIHVKPLSGFEMLAKLREMPWAKTIPIVALTASVMNEEVHKLQTAGFTGCLAKPVDMDSFPETIQHILAGEAIWRI